MAEIALPVIITAIANSDLEGFVAGALYSQGWNVVYRALDSSSLDLYLESHTELRSDAVLIYSPDLPGLSPTNISEYQSKTRQVIGFSSDPTLHSEYVGIYRTPLDAAELLNLVRGFVRAPLLRNSPVEKVRKRRARVIAIGTPSGSSGCTTLAINLAMELSILQRETLLLDADVRRPSIAPLLALHKLGADEFARTVAPHLSVSEFTQDRMSNLDEYLDHLTENYDLLIIDLGAIDGISDALTDRRWTSSLVHWSCEKADELWFLGRADTLGIHRLESLARDFSQITIRAKVSVLLNMRAPGRKGSDRDALFLTTANSLRPQRTYTLPRDNRSVIKAAEERSTLVEVDDRSPLRRAISKLAVELIS